MLNKIDFKILTPCGCQGQALYVTACLEGLLYLLGGGESSLLHPAQKMWQRREGSEAS